MVRSFSGAQPADHLGERVGVEGGVIVGVGSDVHQGDLAGSRVPGRPRQSIHRVRPAMAAAAMQATHVPTAAGGRLQGEHAPRQRNGEQQHQRAGHDCHQGDAQERRQAGDEGPQTHCPDTR
jgi:hypothetical protein